MKTKKLIAPIIITIFLVLYFLGFLLTCFLVPMPLGAKILGALIPAALIGVSVYVLFERMKEIRSGEEDDLSNY